ncbi:MAG TPA: hypothetical protein VLD65_10095 [Anaerolineales bacterium]|nr:hypothetical protein [Anaerolineales bacterium]
MKDGLPKPLSASTRPRLAGVPNPTCPILLEARSVLDKAHDLNRAIRRLRLSTQRCISCPERMACPTVTNFAQAVDIAIRELRSEWGLDQE